MTKATRLRVSIIAAAIIFTGIGVSSGQTSQTVTPGTSIQTAPKKNPATAELKNFQADPSNPQLSEAKLALLQEKANLEKGINDQSLSSDQITAYQARISQLEARVNELQASDPKSIELARREQLAKQASQQDQLVARKAAMVSIYDQRQCTRAQFASLSPEQQREAMVNVNNLKITDLINVDAASSTQRNHKIDYINENDFMNLDANKKIQILANPDSYKVVRSGSVMPKRQISRDVFNTLPAESQKNILESNQYEIIN